VTDKDAFGFYAACVAAVAIASALGPRPRDDGEEAPELKPIFLRDESARADVSDSALLARADARAREDAAFEALLGRAAVDVFEIHPLRDDAKVDVDDPRGPYDVVVYPGGAVLATAKGRARSAPDSTGGATPPTPFRAAILSAATVDDAKDAAARALVGAALRRFLRDKIRFSFELLDAPSPAPDGLSFERFLPEDLRAGGESK
jgi:hypothetical protein